MRPPLAAAEASFDSHTWFARNSSLMPTMIFARFLEGKWAAALRMDLYIFSTSAGLIEDAQPLLTTAWHGVVNCGLVGEVSLTVA